MAASIMKPFLLIFLIFTSSVTAVDVNPRAVALIGTLLQTYVGVLNPATGSLLGILLDPRGLVVSGSLSFPDSLVQVQCGPASTIIAATTTDSSSVAALLLDVSIFPLSYLLNNCTVRVSATPSTASNNSQQLQSLVDVLVGPLNLVGGAAVGGVNVTLMVPSFSIN